MYYRKFEVTVELQKLLAEEEIFRLQNTDYFHRIVKRRRRRNHIFSLSVGDVTIEGTDNLPTHATAFYGHLFGLDPSNLCSLVDNVWKALKICVVLLLSGLTGLENF